MQNCIFDNVAISQQLSNSGKLALQHDCSELNPQKAFMIAMEKLQAAEKFAPDFSEVKTLLNIAGFSQKGRNRITHLSSEEIEALYACRPRDEVLWNSYINEIQVLLSKMDQIRKMEVSLGQSPSMGRPYVTIELAGTINKLACLRYLCEIGALTLIKSKLRRLLLQYDRQMSATQFLDQNHSSDELTGTPIFISSTIRLLELFRDELIAPPNIKSRDTFDEADLHLIEIGDFSWMDDGGKSFWEDIRDLPLRTLYDDLPQFEPVLDWFLAAKPALDHNQIKRGWTYLEKLCREWHERYPKFFYEDYISDLPSWNCIAADYLQEWLATLPPNNPYIIVPLTTPQQLLEESEVMRHCVATYLENCLGGDTRIFSIREAGNDERVGTIELAIVSGRWEMVQLKGKCNALLPQALISDDPLAITLDIFVGWYNKKSSVLNLNQ